MLVRVIHLEPSDVSWVEAGIPAHDDRPSDDHRAHSTTWPGGNLQEELPSPQDIQLVHDSHQEHSIWYIDACFLFQGLQDGVRFKDLQALGGHVLVKACSSDRAHAQISGEDSRW